MPASVPRPILLLISGLLLLNFALSWLRWDLVPAVAGFDEAMINDAAIGLARTGELHAPSLKGSPPGTHYALYPPGYLLLQGLMFRVFGLNAWSLRLTAKLAHMAACSLGLLLLRILWQRGVLGGAAAATAAILWLADFAAFQIGRQARMESLEVMFALGAAYVLARRPDAAASWWKSALLLGLAASMHPSAILFWVVLLIGLWFARPKMPNIAVAVLPVAIAAAIWIAGHREHFFDSIRLFREWNSFRVDQGLALRVWWDAITGLELKPAIPVGLTSYWVAIAGWLLGISRLRAARQNPWLGFAVACAVVHFVMALFFTGMLAQRVMLYYPIAILTLALAVETLGPRARRVALAAAVLWSVTSFAAMAIYTQAGGNRAMNRFDRLGLPASVHSVAATTELWHYFVDSERTYRIVDPTMSYWTVPQEQIDEWDAVIVPEGDAILEWPQLARRRKLYFEDFTGRLVVCLKSGVSMK